MIRARSLTLRCVVMLLVVGLLGWTGGALARAEDKVVFTIKDSRIAESSGLTRDVPGDRYWTINDSGNPARAYAISTSGKTLGYLKYQPQPVDVEALAYFKGNLYLADIGDNTSKRQSVSIFKIYNPTPNGESSQYQSYDFTYPDGPRDAEAMLIDKTGRIYFISKEADGGVYRAPEFPSRLRSNRLTRIADAPSFVTDGQFLPNGNIAVRTYVSVQILNPKSYQVIAQAPTPAEPQGESLAVDLKGNALLVGSEGKNQPVYSMAIPTSVAKAPKAGATPGTPTPLAPTTTTTATAGSDSGSDDSSPSSNIAMTLLVAGAVAVVAGLVTFFIRRR